MIFRFPLSAAQKHSLGSHQINTKCQSKCECEHWRDIVYEYRKLSILIHLSVCETVEARIQKSILLSRF